MIKGLTTTSKAITILSFVIGTILFALYLFVKGWETLLFAGIIFVIGAIILNSISLFTMLLLMIFHPKERLLIIQTCGLILLNIPVVILYFYILFIYT